MRPISFTFQFSYPHSPDPGSTLVNIQVVVYISMSIVNKAHINSAHITVPSIRTVCWVLCINFVIALYITRSQYLRLIDPSIYLLLIVCKPLLFLQLYLAQRHEFFVLVFSHLSKKKIFFPTYL